MNSLYAKTFEVVAVFIHRKSMIRSALDVNQMLLPEVMGPMILAFDSTGEAYLNDVHYIDFEGVTPSAVYPTRVSVSLGRKEDRSFFDILIESTVEEVRQLRSPERQVEQKEEAAPADAA